MKAVKKKGKKRHEMRGQAPELPINEAESNKLGDRICTGLSLGLIAAAVAMLVGGLYWGGSNFVQAVTAKPPEIASAIIMAGLCVVSVFAARSLFWMSFFGSIMLASRMNAWKTVESVGRRALKLHKYIPNGSGWASMALVQSLVGRGQFDEAIAVADDEWERSHEDEKQLQNLGPLCAAVGIAHQVKGDLKQTMTWNERAISALTASLEQLAKPQKGLLASATASQSAEWSGQVKSQLAVAHFNNATIHFNGMNYRAAKANFKKALDFANQSPDFPQKSDIVNVCKEQMSRLKHT